MRVVPRWANGVHEVTAPADQETLSEAPHGDGQRERRAASRTDWTAGNVRPMRIAVAQRPAVTTPRRCSRPIA